MQYLIIFLAFTVFALTAFVLSKTKLVKQEKRAWKIVCGFVFVAVFVARYYSYIEYPVDGVVGLKNSPLTPFATVVTVLSVAFSQTAFLILSLKPFYPCEFLRIMAKYFCLPAYVLYACIAPFTVTLLMGPTFSPYAFSAVMLYIEIAFGLFLSAVEWVKEPSFNKPQKGCYNTVIGRFTA